MENPFEIIARRLSTIEELLIDIKHKPAAGSAVNKVDKPTMIDFQALMLEYYPGIPESTVRQDTARLSRTKIGKRILFERTEIEEHLRAKRRLSASERDQLADTQFAAVHQRIGGRKSA